jgi:hypothetical protein
MPQPTLTVTKNSVHFRGADDLTDETHATILAIFELEMANTFGADFLKTGLRAMHKVADLARTAGWSATEVMYLEAVAADMYADIMREAAQDIAIDRREARRG